MQPRRFIICYRQTRDISEEREVLGSPEDALRSAWQMLQDGSAKVAAIIEPGNLTFNLGYGAILRWGQQQTTPIPSAGPDQAPPKTPA